MAWQISVKPFDEYWTEQNIFTQASQMGQEFYWITDQIDSLETGFDSQFGHPVNVSIQIKAWFL